MPEYAFFSKGKNQAFDFLENPREKVTQRGNKKRFLRQSITSVVFCYYDVYNSDFVSKSDRVWWYEIGGFLDLLNSRKLFVRFNATKLSLLYSEKPKISGT